MDSDDAVYKGFLLFPPLGKILTKKWQQKYCLLFKASKFGIERLEVYDSSDMKSQPRILTLENVIKIAPKNSTSSIINIITKSGDLEFAATDQESMKDWLVAIQSVAFPDEISKITSIEEDNDLYCSSGEGVFIVKVLQSPASLKCGLENTHYTLVLTTTAIQLRNLIDSKLLFTWPYCYIRRYGYKNRKFTFEAGRKCESGEGTFFLEHSNQQEIFRCLASKMKSMKKVLTDSNPNLLDCGEVQLHAALSMEARSRSPLPPSPTSSLPIQDSNSSNKSRMVFTDFDSRQQHSYKPQPVKPPRKYVPTTKNSPPPPYSSKTSLDSVYEPIDKYDQVEVINDAWKTMGIDDVNHKENRTEEILEEEDKEYMSWGERKMDRIEPPIKRTVAPSIITQPTTNLKDASYDKLNFFGSSSKLNAKSGYKQVFPAPVVAMPSPPSFNEYDEVQCIESARPADDSHLGYALIRKDPGQEGLRVTATHKKALEKVIHQFHNNEPYAVISKAKEV